MTPRPSTGLLHLAFPALLLVGALDAALSGRNLSESFAALEALSAPARQPLAVWVQRAVSLLLLAAAVEQVVNHRALGRRTPSPWLLAGFLAYWAGNVAAPSLLGAYPRVSHDLLYAPALGVAACLVDPREHDRILRLARDTLMALMLAGVLMIPLRLHLVLDTGYAEGLLQGLPRFAGLTAHPVTQGLLAQTALLLLWARPYPQRWARRAGWALGLGVLLIAQSKTAWIAFCVCLLALAWVRHGTLARRRLADPRRQGLALAAGTAWLIAVVAGAAWVLLGDASTRIADFMHSEQGAQLVSLTGRDRIWTAAAQEWQAHPVFGYGLSLWDPVYRASIGLPNATHAHNQFMDDAARAGSVGAAMLVLYALVLAALSLRFARATGGLSLALFLTIALRAVSEVPLGLLGYGTELFTHLLLLSTLAAAAASARPRPARPAPLRHGVAS